MKTFAKIITMGLLCWLARPSLGQTKPSNQELKIGITQEFENLNPLIGNMFATRYLLAMVYRPAVIMDAQGQWIPQLVKEIPSLENKKAMLVTKSGRVVLVSRWQIRDNATWGDGTPITCEDFKFSWQVGSNKNVSVPSREAFENIESIEFDIKKPLECVYTFKVAKWDYFQSIPSPLPKHIEGSVYEKYKDQKEGYDQNSNYNKQPTLPGLYNGPYLVSELSLGSHVIMIPNPKFYGTPAKIKKIVVKLIPNTGTLEANLRSGNIDMISTLGLSFDEAIAFEKRSRADNLPYNVSFQTGTTYEHIDLNLDNEILKDLKVRQALIHAINRPELTKSLFDGKQAPALHDRSPVDPVFTKDPKKVVIYEANKRAARQLLDEAGWVMGTDGIRTKKGQRLTLQLMTTAGNKTRELVQTMLQSQWREVGIEVIIKNEPARVFFGDTLKQRKFSALAMFAWTTVPGNGTRAIQHSEEIPTSANNWSGVNYTGWKNKKVDDLYSKFDSEFDSKKRVGLLQEIMLNYTKDIPVIPLFYRSEVAVLPKTLRGHVIPGHAFSETYSVENWTVE